MNIFLNKSEHRLRTFWRVLVFIFLFGVLALPVVFLPSGALQLMGMAVASVAAVWISARFIDHRAFAAFGLKPGFRWVEEMLTGYGAGVIAMSFIFGFLYLFGWIGIVEIRTEHIWGGVALYFLQMLFVGIWEETVFRGYLVRNLADGFSYPRIKQPVTVFLALTIPALLFGLGHAWNPNAGFVSTVVIIFAGVVIGIPYVLTGRLGFSIGLHASWNFVQGGIYGFAVSGMENRNTLIEVKEQGSDLITGGAFGPEAGLSGFLGLVLVLVLFYSYLRWRGGDLQISDSFTESYTSKPNMVDVEDDRDTGR